MAEPQIRLENVGLTLPSQAGDVEILKDITLDIAAGERITIMGPSGSGKSSLLMVASGLERPSSGNVTVLGKNLSQADEDSLARLRRAQIGVVFQAFHLIPTMTALENIQVPLEIAGRADALETARQMLDAIDLPDRASHYPAQLSGGEQQRIALARAMAPSPAILFADEPTGNLDGTTGQAVTDLMFTMAERAGCTLVLVTHSEALAAHCPRVVRLSDGRIAA